AVEVSGLAEQYRQRGLSGLHRLIVERSGASDGALYLLTSPAGRPISGNLTNLPPAAADGVGWIDFAYRPQAGDSMEGEGPPRAARARLFGLSGDYVLLVGRDVSERRAIERMVTNALGGAGLLTFALGVGGGVFISRNMMRRLDAVNRTSREIMAGDLTRRVGVSGSGDELDQLAVNLNAMLDQIERLMAGMREVSDNVAHDLRSPLTRLRNQLETLLRDRAGDERAEDALEGALQDADQLLDVFNGLLRIARLEAGERREDLAVVDASEIAQDVAELFAPLAEEAGFTFVTELAEGCAVRGAPELLAQALSNLMDNALKYARDGRTIALRVRRAGDVVALCVSDDGPGVAEADREKAMARFGRLERSRALPGSGLGLSLVGAVATYHEGEFELGDSDLGEPGRPGLSACLHLPPAKTDPQPLGDSPRM
ncbi:MAG: HAMP domain-containing sensor histidine kinase, partial [Pseudomonadota bacterium]